MKIKIYRTIILVVVLYGCETWSLTLREECRLRVFKNRLLRKIFGPKRGELTKKWRGLIHYQNVRKEYFSLLLSLLKMWSGQQCTCVMLVFFQHV
jgi:hypothetical protein